MAELEKQQYGFHGGEISKESLGRKDIERWQISLEIMRNWQSLAEGGSENRPGSEIVGYEHKEAVDYMTHTFTATSQTNPVIITENGHDRTDGDVIMIITDSSGIYSGLESAVEVIDANSFYFLNHDASDEISSQNGTYRPITASGKVREIPYSFNADDTYMLYFGDKWMMVSRNGAMVLDSTGGTVNDIDYASQGDMATLTLDADHGWHSGVDVYIEDFTPILAKDHGQKRYRAELVPTATVEDLVDITYVDIGIFAPDCPTAVIAYVNWDISDPLNAPFPFNPGDLIRIEGITAGPTELNGRELIVGPIVAAIPGPPSLNAFWFIDHEGREVCWENEWTVWTEGGTITLLDTDKLHLHNTGGLSSSNSAITPAIHRYVRIDTPWSTSDLQNIDYAQDGNTMTLTCPGFTHQTLTRSDHDAWTLEAQLFVPSINPPTTITASEPLVTVGIEVSVTAVSKGTGEESLPIRRYVGVSDANELEWDAVDDAFEYNVYTTPNAKTYSPGFVTTAEGTTASINTTILTEASDQSNRPPTIENPFFVKGDPIQVTGVTNVQPMVLTIDNLDDSNTRAPIDMFYLGDPESVLLGVAHTSYALLTGFTAAGGSVELNNKIVKVTSRNETVIHLANYDGRGFAQDTWSSDGFVTPLYIENNPSAVAHFQQRKIFANTPLHKQAVYMTRSGALNSMGTSKPLVATDAISIELADVRADPIRFLVSMQQLLVMTASGIYSLAAKDGVLVPDPPPVPVPQYHDGVAKVKPVKAGGAVLFIADQGGGIFELRPQAEFNNNTTYVPLELSILAKHLIKKDSVTEIAYAKSPNSILYAVLSNGTMLGLTYYPERQSFAFHRNDTPGDYESVATIAENGGTGTYISVKRTFSTVPCRYFERFDDRDFVDVRDAFFVDCGIKYDEPFDGHVKFADLGTATLTLAATHTFDDDDLFDIEHTIRGPEGLIPGALDGRRYKVDNKTATTVDAVIPGSGAVVDFTSALSGIDTRTLILHRCTQTVTGAEHLAGQSVAILADGSVKAKQTVTAGGELTFTDPHSRIILGLSIEADMLTLRPDAPGGPFEGLTGERMKSEGIVLTVHRTRGLSIGASADGLTKQAWRSDEGIGDPTELQTGEFDLSMEHKWGSGQVFIRQSDPLPATILALTTKLERGG